MGEFRVVVRVWLRWVGFMLRVVRVGARGLVGEGVFIKGSFMWVGELGEES